MDVLLGGVQKYKNKMKRTRALQRKIIKEYKDATHREIWEGVRDNFIFGFLGAILVVFIATKTDLGVLFGYLAYYFFMGKIVNRPKYITDLGKLIVFPIPSAIGAFVGYKTSSWIIDYIIQNLR